MLALVLMLAISHGVIYFCEWAFHEDPLVLKGLVYTSDVLIAAHFVWYLNPIHTKNSQILTQGISWNRKRYALYGKGKF